MLDPLPAGALNRSAAAHLLNRAGFGARPEEIEEAAGRGLTATLDRLFEFHRTRPPVPPPEWWTPESDRKPDRSAWQGLSEEERREKQAELGRADAQRLLELRGWWLERMRSGPYPLQEKLTLFWHGHFATGQSKVRSAYMMWRQNQTLREHAAGNWREMLRAISRDPAMLVWLDTARSRRRSPNENYARELMELFTLGEGNYTETDIREAARAFTGWTLEANRFAFRHRPKDHDPGVKTVLGVTGALDGDGAIDAILAQPQAAAHLARRLWDYFVSPDPDPAAVDALAETLRAERYELEPALRALFSSRIFHSERVRRCHVKSPTHWLIGTLRVLDIPLPQTRRCVSMLQALGQHLFDPPNVKGWDGGMGWITASSLLERYRFAEELIRRAPGDARRWLPPDTASLTWGAFVRRLCERVFQDPLRAEDRSELLLRLPPWPPAEWGNAEVREAMLVLMRTVYYQLV